MNSLTISIFYLTRRELDPPDQISLSPLTPTVKLKNITLKLIKVL